VIYALGTPVSPAETAEPIKMPLGGQFCAGSWNQTDATQITSQKGADLQGT